ncbi:MAG: GAF domain-containing sensor histidine kinase, partial [Nocardioides sp.]|nr:GAF domain-containing sensor histidine kinase [Nocardioides sp.]
DAEGRTQRGTETPEDLVGRQQPVSRIEEVMADADDWGLFKFLPHERYVEKYGDAERLAAGSWIPDITDHRRDPRAWRPCDFLAALIRDDAGELVGVVSVDMPVSGRRPGPASRRILERFARQARKAVLLYSQREQLAQRAHAVEVARSFLRDAGTGLTLQEVLAGSQEALIRGLDADALYVETNTADGELVSHASEGLRWTPSALSIEAGRQGSEALWEARTYAVITRDNVENGTVRPGHVAEARRFLDAGDAESALIVPVGADQERLGHFVLLRGPGRAAWSEAEGRLALELGQDLGRFVLTSNMYTHERDLADRLRTADSASSRLIEAVSRELQAPLVAIATGLAAVRLERPLQPAWYAQLEALLARSDQLESIVKSLLFYSRVSDPDSGPELGYVDLVELLDEISQACEDDALARGISGTIDTPTRPAYVMGERTELREAILNMVDNALVYTHRGGKLALSLKENGVEAAVSVIDSGVGIPESEQPHVWTEFFRGSSPALGGMKGAGLGLTITKQVARRHRGRVTLRSRPGAGTRASIVLPLAYDASDGDPSEGHGRQPG